MTVYRNGSGWVAVGNGLVACGPTKRMARAELAIKRMFRERLPWRQVPPTVAGRVHGAVMGELRKQVRP